MHRKQRIRWTLLSGISFGIVLIFFTVVTYAAWSTPVTADGRDVSQYGSLAVVYGPPAISEHDDTDDDLEHVEAVDEDGRTWLTPVDVNDDGDVRHNTSLAVVNGRPALNHYDVSNDRLKYTLAPDGTSEQHDFGSSGTQRYIYSDGRSWDFVAENTMTVSLVETKSRLAHNPSSSSTTFHIRVKINDVTIGSWDESITSDVYTDYYHSSNVSYDLVAGDTITYFIYGGTLSTAVGAISGPNYVRLSALPDTLTVNIEASGTSDVLLTWNQPDPPVLEYEVWRSGVDPYFDPGSDCDSSPDCTVVFTENHIDSGALGDVDNNYSYLVLAVDEVGRSEPSNRVGEFDFSLEPGDIIR